MRLRQIAFVAEDLKSSSDDLCAVLGLDIAYRDPGVAKWGLENVVVPLGGDFLEIVSPTQGGTSAGRYLQRRHGDGGYMVILQGPDALADRTRVTGMGIRAVATADRGDYFYTHFHPADVGGFLLSLDSVTPGADWLEEQCEWAPAGPRWKEHVRTDVSRRLRAVELQSENPATTAELWSRILQRPARRVGEALHLSLDHGDIRFVIAADGRGTGIHALDIEAADPGRILAEAEKRGLKRTDTQVEVCGCRINLV